MLYLIHILWKQQNNREKVAEIKVSKAELQLP